MDLTDESLDLARRAVACSRWRWMEGMRTVVRPSRIKPSISIGGRRVTDDRPATADDLPDLDDPATVGCLEALVQRVLGHDGKSVVVEVRWTAGTHRVVRWRHRGHMGWSPTTFGGESHPSAVAALVAALKAAP